MSGDTSLWTDDETGLTVTVRPLDRGRCTMRFHSDDIEVTICSTRRSLVTAALGARSHFASTEGACEFIRIGDRLRVKVQQWRGMAAEMDIDRISFQTAVRKLEDAQSRVAREIKLF